MNTRLPPPSPGNSTLDLHQGATRDQFYQPGIAAESPHRAKPRSGTLLFFHINDAGLLIVPPLFFIHRRNGEVAEWSKALPC